MTRENAWTKCDKKKIAQVMDFAEEYRRFLSECKTERECTKRAVEMAEENGYLDLMDVIAKNKTLKPGDKVYASNMGKAIVLFNIGTKPIEQGMKILGAHIDSPRLDIKQNPLYEDEELVLMDTHYYGGIKKYQWVALPLALHGVVALTKTKAYILKLLQKKYGFKEEDFMSAELEAVPAGPARNMGIDNSMIMGYGQDDRVCAYTSLVAMLKTENPEKTTACLLVDKEEIGSVGATGMESRFFENMVAELIARLGAYDDLKLRRALTNSQMLSSDVNAAYDPNYASAFEKKNASFFGRGIVFNKFTGARGKSGSNDANAEYVAKVRAAMERDDVAYQMAELGKVDVGGGGTIAYILANYGMEVMDCGVAVQNMHAPYEVTSKIDIYETMRGYLAFLK